MNAVHQLAFCFHARQIHICSIFTSFCCVLHDQIIVEFAVGKGIRNLHGEFQIVHAVDFQLVF